MQVLTLVRRSSPTEPPRSANGVCRERGPARRDGRTRISLSKWRWVGRAATRRASERRSAEEKQSEGDGAITVRSPSSSTFCSPHSSTRPGRSSSTRAVTTCWPAPQRGRSELLTNPPDEATFQEVRNPVRHTDDPRSTGCGFASGAHRSSHRTARQAEKPCADATCHSRAHCRLSRLRPSFGLPGRALEEGRFLVPRPWIVEACTTSPSARPQTASTGCSAGRGCGGHQTPSTTSRPRPAANTTENTTHWPIPPTKLPGPTMRPNVADEDGQGR